ncbi:MAG: ABC transporter substrate binding protein [Thermodesulfobacteriota bacterium]
MIGASAVAGGLRLAVTATVPMPRALAALLFILALLPAASGWAAEVLILQAATLEPYAQARAGVEAGLAEAARAQAGVSVEPFQVETILVSDQESPVAAREAVAGRRPALVVAIGSSALALVKDFSTTPIVYLLVPFPSSILNSAANATGVLLDVPLADQLAAAGRALPAVKRVGLVCNPTRSAALLADARDAAKRLGLELRAQLAAEPGDTPHLVDQLAGTVDLFWMLPDPFITTSESVEYLLSASLRYRIPVLTFSAKFLQTGAALAVLAEPAAMGEQAARLAARILAGASPASLPAEPPAKPRLRINPTVWQRLELLAPDQEKSP